MPKESKPNSCRKPFKSLEEQLDILKSRGLLVFDEGAAIECLHRNGYYRLSACWYPFYDVQDGARVDIFRENSHFEDAANLCVFDKDFKLLLLSAIERIEIAARVEIARCLGKKDAFAYLDPKFFKSTFTIPSASSDPVKCTRGEQGDSECALAQQAILSDHESWLLKYENAFDRSKEVFVRHHKENHGESEPLPVWIAIELWDFGLLS